MSSITATLPVGPMHDWCLTGHNSDPNSFFRGGCTNATAGHEADFATICCDGEIIDTAADLWFDRNTTDHDLENWVCCRQSGFNPGGLLPLPEDYTHCASGEPTPLASLAATNTDNAQNFAVTYESASAGTADWTTRSWPSCLWVNTRNVSGTTEVVLPKADITTLPAESSAVWNVQDSFTPMSTSSAPATFGRNETGRSSSAGVTQSATLPSSTESRSTAGAEDAASTLSEAAGNAGSKVALSLWSLALLGLPIAGVVCNTMAAV